MAHKSFKTIDVMSAIVAFGNSENLAGERLLHSAAELISNGWVYPFSNRALARHGLFAPMSESQLKRYARISSPWHIWNAAYAYFQTLRMKNVTLVNGEEESD